MQGAHRVVLLHAGETWNVDTSVRISAALVVTGTSAQRNAKGPFSVDTSAEDHVIFQKIASLVIESVMCVVFIQSALNFATKLARVALSRATGNANIRGSAHWYVVLHALGFLATCAAPKHCYAVTDAHRCVASIVQVKSFVRNAATIQKGIRKWR